jgi:mannan endo-1,4-beta-mannosidase
VDIVGRDIYRDGNHSSFFADFADMNMRYGQKKMITMSECGSFSDVDNLIKDGAGWLYYMPWYGKFTTDDQYNSLALWKKMFAHAYVITLNEMPNLKTYVALNHESDPDPEPGIVTSTDEASAFRTLEIYPTIVTDNRLSLRGTTVIGPVSVYNGLGKAMQHYIINADTATITVPAAPGLYYLKQDNSSQTTKFIVR